MGEKLLTARQVLPFPLARVFPFFASAENLSRITPPEVGFQILTPLPIDMHEGTLIDYRIRLHGVPMRWRTLIRTWDPPHVFVDEQIKGPYRQWIHTHRFSEDSNGHTVMEDEVRYMLPFGFLGDLVHPLVRPQINRIFAYRKDVVPDMV